MIPKSINKSLQIAKVKGIPILIHWSFSLLIIFLLYTSWKENMSAEDTFWYLILFFIVFFFVILHELGHSMAAARFGIETKDIIISPIGGIARLTSIPKKPYHELIVALAGPLVNVVLASSFGIVLLLLGGQYLPSPHAQINLIHAPTEYLRFLFIINVVLVVFNMIPAFPMDGGRVFRALLSYKLSREKATKIAMIIARILAAAFMLAGFYYHLPMWIFIGGFVMMTSGMEYRHVKSDYVLNNAPVIGAIINDPTIIDLDYSLSQIAHIKRKDQSHFPVKALDGTIIGVLTKPAIQFGLKNIKTTTDITSLITDSHGIIRSSDTLKTAFSLMDKNNWYTASIYDVERGKIGIIDRTSLERYFQSTSRKKL